MFSDPQFWVAVSFFLFVAAIFNPVRKILISNLDSQINEIKSKIDEAENLHYEAQKTLSELKKREKDVEKEIEELFSESKQRINKLKDASQKKLIDQIEKRKILAENKIDQLLRDTNQNIKNHITNVAINVAEDVLRKNLTDQKKSDLINDSIKDLDTVLKN